MHYECIIKHYEDIYSALYMGDLSKLVKASSVSYQIFTVAHTYIFFGSIYQQKMFPKPFTDITLCENDCVDRSCVIDTTADAAG